MPFHPKFAQHLQEPEALGELGPHHLYVEAASWFSRLLHPFFLLLLANDRLVEEK